LDYAHKGRLGGGYCHVVTVKWTKAAVKSIVANKPRYAKAAMRLRLAKAEMKTARLKTDV